MVKKGFRLGLVLAVVGFVVGSAGAGEMIHGLQITGGRNGLAAFQLNRGPDDAPGMLKLTLNVRGAQEIQGYGFVLNYHADQYEFVEAREVTDTILETGNSTPRLFFAVNNHPGQVSVGSMKVDGEAGGGDGGLVEFTFQKLGEPVTGYFRVTDGVLVDLSLALDAVPIVEVGDLKLGSTSFKLEQNVPNPFNPTTTIAYEIPTAGPVRLVIYNLLGQQVKTLVDETVDAGAYTAAWNGRDALGNAVASGVYLYRMEGDGFSQVKRMLFLK